MGRLRSLWRELPGLFNDRVELLSLELNSAGLALVQIVMLVVVIAILGATGWLVLWVGVVTGLVELGLHLTLALLLAVALNALAGAAAVARLRQLLPMLKLPATRRHLALSPSTQPPTQPTIFTHRVQDALRPARLFWPLARAGQPAWACRGTSALALHPAA